MPAFYENNKMPMRSFPFADLTFSAHLHKEIELLYVQEGEVTATLDGVPYFLSPGDLLVMLPNTIHSYDSVQKSSGILTVFSPELVAEFHYKLTHFSCRRPLLSQEQMPSDIPYCIRNLTDIEASPENLNLIRGHLLVLLSRIFGQLALEPLDLGKDFDLLHRVLLYVTEHFREPLSLDEIARKTGVSKYYLSRTFSDKMGCGLNHYVNSLRVGFAQHLLANPDLSISEAAFECGFESLRTFNRAFREQLEKSPREYREQLKGL